MALNIESNFSDDFNFGIKNKYVPKIVSYNKIGSNIVQQAKKFENYATEDELIYEKKMDLDEDGTITFDEVKKYCEKNKVNYNEVLKKWQAFRMLENEKEVTDEVVKSIDKKENKSDNELIYAKKGDKDYQEEMDTNKDDIISYKEYYDYCSKNEDKKIKADDIVSKYGIDEEDEEGPLKQEGNIEVEA